MVVVFSRGTKAHCSVQRPLSFGVRSYCDVPAAASSAKLAPHFSRGVGAPALAVAGTRRSTRACCERAMPRRLRSAYELPNGTAPARGLSPSVHIRSATRQTWLSTPSAKPAPRVTRRAGAPELAVTREEGQQSSQLCARAMPLLSWPACFLRKPLRQRKAALFRHALVV